MSVTRSKYPALLFLLLAGSAMVNAQPLVGSANTCTNASIDGSYAYTLSGWVVTTTAEYPFADSGELTFDGNGSLSGSSTYSLDGGTQGRTLTGTYSVGSDCTGTATVSDNLGNSMDLNLVIVGNGQSIQLMQSDSNTIISGNATAIPATCALETIGGSYSFAIGGWVYDSSGNPYPYTDAGTLTLGGSGGNATLNDTVSTAGTVATRSISGTYAVNSKCIGTLTLTDSSSGSSHLNFTVGAGALQFIETDLGTTISGSANMLADVIPGGAIAHIAAGGGWQTTFTVINAGTSSSQVQLSFYDDNGNALALPLTYVQTGATTTASTLTHTLAAGAQLVILTQGSSTTTVTEGSAQLTTNGSADVNGFVIFRYNPTAQEAVVPLETRNPAAFVLGFDNTSGLATGLALANVSSQEAKVGVVLRDDTGAVLDTTSISLSARGHTAFVLTTNYSSVKNKRGTVEFDTPPGGQITALGILSTPTGAFTTIPVIVK
jgi:hypothetical protein